MPRPAPRALLAPLALALLAGSAAAPAGAADPAAEQPRWSFAGQLPPIFQVHTPVPPVTYTREGTVLDGEQIADALDIRPGDPVVLIRDAAVVGAATVGEIVAGKHPEASQQRLLFFRPAAAPEGVEVPAAPPGPSVLADASYDLWVFTDRPVEVLAPDPLFQDIPWGVHDYCVRVGRVRYAIIREYWPGTTNFRGWQVREFAGGGETLKVHVDYEWQPAARR